MILEVSGSDGMFIVACAADVMRFPFGIVMSIAVCGNNSLWASLGIVCWRKKWPVLPVSAMVEILVVGTGGPTRDDKYVSCNVVLVIWFT